MVWKRPPGLPRLVLQLTGLLAPVVLLTACPSPAPEDGETDATEARASVDPAAEREALMEADRAFSQVFAEEGVDGWVSFFDKKGIQMPGGTAAAWGREEVERLARRLFDAPTFTSLSWEPVYAQVAAAGDLGFTLGNYLAKGTDEEGQEIGRRGNYVTIWRKQEDGSWKVAFDTGNPGPPLVVPAGW